MEQPFFFQNLNIFGPEQIPSRAKPFQIGIFNKIISFVHERGPGITGKGLIWFILGFQAGNLCPQDQKQINIQADQFQIQGNQTGYSGLS